jgi:hypothetical protein
MEMVTGKRQVDEEDPRHSASLIPNNRVDVNIDFDV